ncbi:MAG: hypothetical protein GY874_01180 [Desulfobacteraceae bacterium]|nr:hypothetical protein [Desulfobacteraceae bacterium]
MSGKSAMMRGICVIYWIIIPVFFGAATGCVTSGKHFDRKVSAQRIFEQYQVDNNYSYYISGHDAKPVAIVGLRKKYTLEAPSWRPVIMTEKQLRTWVDRMKDQPGAEYNIEPNGAYILDNQKNRIGLWYSVWALPIVTFKSDKVLAISQPMTVFPHSNRNRGDNDRPYRWP